MTDLLVTAPTGLRDRHKLRTRQLIQTTAIDLFMRHGYDNVTVDDVAAACEISRATVFRYFPTKEDLVVGGNDECLTEFREAFAARPAGEPVFAAIRHAMSAFASQLQDDCRHTHVRDANQLMLANPALAARGLEHHAAWTETFAELLAQHERGENLPNLRERVLAASVSAAMKVAASDWFDEGGPSSSLPALLDDVLAMLASGFARD